MPDYQLPDFEEMFQHLQSYGGRQSWFLEGQRGEYLAQRGCGIIAASHALLYLGFTREAYADLWPGSPLTRDHYMAYLRDLTQHLYPTYAGIFLPRQMIRGVQHFARSKGLTLNPHLYRGSWREEEIFEFIHGGIRENTPVLLLTWNHHDLSFRNHWVSITGIGLEEDKRMLIASNWGIRYRYALANWVRGFSIHRSLIYFT